MEYLHKYISRREYILWTLLFLAIRGALTVPFFFEWFSIGNYSMILHVFALWGDLCTLAVFSVLSARRFASLGQSPALALLVLIPIVKFGVMLYLAVVSESAPGSHHHSRGAGQ